MSESVVIRHLYVHVPFCQSKCPYCDFYSVRYEANLAYRYARALRRELALYAVTLGDLETVYIGGGTPSVLGYGELEAVISAITESIRREAGCEFTVEANPATLDEKKVFLLREHGVNRISLGVQSFSDSILKMLGRGHSAEEAREASRLAATSFENFSLDLIYGVPSQSRDVWVSSLKQALEFAPTHVSAYELTPEAATPLSGMLRGGGLKLPGEGTLIAMQEAAVSETASCGYRRYEISNYCVPGFQARHNLNCWRRGEYVGLGPSAHSFQGDIRRSNVSDILRYCEALERGAFPIAQTWEISPEEAVREAVFLGLRTDEGVDLMTLTSGLAESRRPDSETVLRGLQQYLDRGLMTYGRGRLTLTPMGTRLANPLMGEVMKAMGV